MIDIDKQIAYWQNGAQEDWEVARELIDRGRIRHGLFFVHLALEKVLKAHVCRQTRDLAPRIHNLVRLAELAAINASQEQMDTLAEMNALNIEGRYPESLLPQPTPAEAQAYLARAEEVFQWLIHLL
ncbi:MAG: HEPN domain-containing protein [Candidatus Tectomicrobia bacterium]|uniref:HEPN domain-containing protein n=1 Tax=Tectimicrobiota bacterium TaxID=2528274 RepID=A0A932CNS4_UNCTE|nr:HEPN domain-containing protein [Candidatus Tectomicrobia bacterium]